MKTAIYAGLFDPVTYGHLDIIKRAREAFDEVWVVIGSNPNKKYALSLKVREKLLVELTRQIHGVKVVPIGNRLLVDFAYEHNIKHIIKGVRNNQDFDYERMMHEVNATQRRGIETHILISRPELAHVSSSATKELARYHGIIHEYVPMKVKQTLEYVNGQIIVGVTGTIAAGKSTITKMIEDDYHSTLGTSYRNSGGVANIDLDKLAHELITTDKSPLAWNLRMDIRTTFKIPYFMPNDPIDRKLLGEKVFGNTEELAKLNNLFREPLLFKIRQAIAACNKRIILLNGALLAEANLLFLCNNNVLLVTANNEDTYKRLHGRGLTVEQIERRLQSQYTAEKKLQIIQERIREDGCGYVSAINTSTWKVPEHAILVNHWDLEQRDLQRENQK